MKRIIIAFAAIATFASCTQDPHDQSCYQCELTVRQPDVLPVVTNELICGKTPEEIQEYARKQTRSYKGVREDGTVTSYSQTMRCQ